MTNKPYTIYAIFCTVTRQRYIGKTLRPNKRKIEHFQALRACKHHSTKLQQAFNQYGETAFEWRIIEEGISYKKGEKREIYWIAYFDSFNNGYNMNDGTYDLKPPKPTTWNGIQYESVTAAAEALGIERTTMRDRIERGYKQDSDVQTPPPDPKPITWNGINYPSIAAAARALGITHRTLRERLGRGYTKDSDMPPVGKPVTWNGKQYSSIVEAARDSGITDGSIRQFLRRGYKGNSDISTRSKRKPVIIDGKEYESISAAAKELDVSWRVAKSLAQRSFKPDSE